LLREENIVVFRNLHVLSYMQFFAKKYLITICLVVSVLASSFAQEQRHSFTWLDRTEKPMAGLILSTLSPLAIDGSYQLSFTVTWFDQDGKPVLDINQMPYLCLSKYDLDIAPAQNLKCTTFETNKSSGLTFQTTGSLIFQVTNGYEGPIRIKSAFQYALNKSLYDQGKSEKIDIKGTHVLALDFQIKSQRPNDLAKEVKNPDDIKLKNSGALRSAATHYQDMVKQVSDLESGELVGEMNQPNFLQNLDALVALIDKESMSLHPDSLPADTLLRYRERYNQLNYRILNIKTTFFRLQVSQMNEGSGIDRPDFQKNNDSLRKLIRGQFEPIVLAQIDSLVLLSANQKSIALDISSLLVENKRRRIDGPRIDSLVNQHGLIKQSVLVMQQSHDSVWNGYLIALGGLLPEKSMDNIHSTFITNSRELILAFEKVDTVLATLQANQSNPPWYNSNRLIWMGLLGILVLVFVSALWSSSRYNRMFKERISTFLPGHSDPRQVTPTANGLFPGEVLNEYFTLDYKNSIPESVVGIIYFHSSAIKSVYHLVQGAMLDKKGDDFGGYLFGNHYKLPGKGASKSEIFIEKVCDSSYLRSSIANDINARADLVDELDKLVQQNKKYRLLGWFTSSMDSSMEVPEGLMKIHRTFFKEKWQIGIIINPSSDVLQGAGFFRRKSGYLDPMPDPAAFVKFDELYRFALNPAKSTQNELEIEGIEEKDFSRISLNNTWGDSIVTAVNFNKSVLNEISSVAAQQAIPKDTYQNVGYVYGKVATKPSLDGKPSEYEIYILRFIELANELTPREIPGLVLLGWWGQANVDVINYLQSAIDYHEQIFQEPFQISCLVNPATGELRIFTRKHSLVMNNSTIETEEYQLKTLLFG
jgi:hypothetical protein